MNAMVSGKQGAGGEIKGPEDIPDSSKQAEYHIHPISAPQPSFSTQVSLLSQRRFI